MTSEDNLRKVYSLLSETLLISLEARQTENEEFYKYLDSAAQKVKEVIPSLETSKEKAYIEKLLNTMTGV